MQYHRIAYQPRNPITRFLAVIAGIGLLALTLFLGVIFLAVFIALGALAWAVFSVRRWWLGRGQDAHQPRAEDQIVDAEYRVVQTPEETDRNR